jgi:hypothetical protein
VPRVGWRDEKRIATELLYAIEANTRHTPPKLPGAFQKVLFVMEVEERHDTQFFVKEGRPRLEIIDRLNKQYIRGAFQRAQAYYRTEEMKLGRKNFSDIPPPGMALD